MTKSELDKIADRLQTAWLQLDQLQTELEVAAAHSDGSLDKLYGSVIDASSKTYDAYTLADGMADGFRSTPLPE